MIGMLKIAVLGDRQTVVGFKALGLSVFPVTDGEDAKRTFWQLTRQDNGYAIIYVEESYAEALAQEIDKFKDSPSPAVILIPGRDGSLGLGLNALNAAVERAVGSNIV